jgi:hypothetical protein
MPQQQLSILKTGNRLLETGDIINDIERLANETEGIATDV